MNKTSVAQQAKTASFIPAIQGILQRKCACGNQTVAGGECVECKKKKSSLQRKLAIGASNDPLEQEADRVANQVMAASAHSLVRGAPPCIQRFSGQATESTDTAPASVDRVLAVSGRPLEPALRQDMEQRFGHDFSRVRVHSGSAAEQSARDVNANAYTVGHNVVFGADQFTPGTRHGRWLLAHELTHVVQQRNTAEGSVPEVTVGRMAMIQRQEICEPEAEASQSLANVIYDYENQVCRAPDPDESAASVPESDPVDGEFWIWPSRLREGAQPIFDDEDTSVIVGFRYSSGGYYEIYDLEGNFIESGEPGLETPLIDPIDIIAGGITGLGRGLIGGGGRALARGVAGGVGRGGGSALARAGLAVAIRTLSRRAVTAIRGVYRAIRFRGILNFTGTTIARMADPARRVPHHILKLAIRFGTRSPDPQGVAGAFRYVIPMIRNGREYTLEVVIREADKTVLHFLYR